MATPTPSSTEKSETNPFDDLKVQVEQTVTNTKSAIPALENINSLKEPLSDSQREALRSAIQQLFDYERKALQQGTSASAMIQKINFLTWLRNTREPLRALLFKNGELLIKLSDQVLTSVQNQSREAAATLNQLTAQASLAVKEASSNVTSTSETSSTAQSTPGSAPAPST